MKMKRWIGFVCTLVMITSLFAGCGGSDEKPVTETKPAETKEEVKTEPAAEAAEKPEPVAAAEPVSTSDTPRNETLYFAGNMWGAIQNFNLISGNPAWPVNYGNSREIIYETLFMINMLDGKLEPLLGSTFTWTDDLTLRVELNKDAHWSDGQPFTSEDVVYTYKLAQKYAINWSNYWQYLTDVAADGPNAVKITMKPENPNKLTVLDSIEMIPMLPKHIWEKIEADNNNDLAEIRKVFMENPIGSGPYKLHFYNDQKITVIRDDNYWGQKLFGSLAAPKYLTHTIFKDNAAGDLAFKNGEVDISQQFTPQIWKMWESGAPIGTYLKDAPYYLPGSMPTIFFNTTKPGLDNKDVRRAIAMCIDYKKVSDLAMSGYSAAMSPALILASDAEKQYVDMDAIKSLQWTTDVAGANALLDKIGAKKGSDGIRVLKGTKLGPYDIECPYGWSDWNASLEIVAQCAKDIGIEIRTKFPEQPVWTNDRDTGKFDILMNTPAGGISPSQPWRRSHDIVYSKGVPAVGEMAFWNWGRYKNDRADEIIDKIPTVTDMAELKSLYTELNKIWLTDVPTIPLMYRPWMFYSYNQSVWTGFPKEGDGTNIPPQMCCDGAGIKALYVIKAK